MRRRRVPALKTQLINTLRSYGMEVIGATPCRPNWQAVRPQEITSWLQAYHETAGTMRLLLQWQTLCVSRLTASRAVQDGASTLSIP